MVTLSLTAAVIIVGLVVWSVPLLLAAGVIVLLSGIARCGDLAEAARGTRYGGTIANTGNPRAGR